MDIEARKRVEQREPAEQAGFEGTWDWDVATGTLSVSPRFLTLTGIPARGSYRIADWFERIHPDDLPWLFASFEDQEHKLRPFYMEHRVRVGATGWHWLACRGVVAASLDQPQGGGTIRRRVGAIIDITEIKLTQKLLRQSEDRYTLASAAASDGLYDWDLNTGKIYYSSRWKGILGFAAHEITDSPDEWLGRVLPEDLIWLQATLEEQIRPSTGPVPSFQIEYRIRAARDVVRWMVCRGMAVHDDDGRAVRLIGSQADITDRKLAEQQLRLSEERYALAARGANDGLWDWRLDTGETYLSPRCLSMLGYDDVALVNRLRDWYRLVHPDDRSDLRKALICHLRGETVHLAHEIRMLGADGAKHWCQIRAMAVRDGNNKPIRIAGSVTDITARKKAELRIQYNAFHDGLTGLPNRSLLIDRIGQAIARQQTGGGRHFAVVLLDIDRFKSINDSLGSAMGDLVLTTTAARLLRIRRTGDTLARLSADEFAILIEDIGDPTAALIEAQRSTAAVARPFHFQIRDIVLTASAGIALSASGYRQAEDMLRDASLAMVRAKTNGCARAEVFDTRLRDHAMAQVRTESELRRALEESALRVYYQPIVHLATRRPAGVEALVRWQHPTRGLVPPLEFIAQAEDTGLIVPIGRWVLETAAAQLVAWQADYPRLPLFTCVNVSTRQLRDDNLLAAVREVIRKTGIAPDSLKLEITESLLINDRTDAAPMLQAIRNLGVHFSIDDFGTGYSSLSYLHRLPADTLKIDKSFVSAITNSADKAAIVQVIATLACILKMDVVAEGIECEAEEQFLRDLCCQYGQGYFYGRPMPADQLGEWLKEAVARDNA